MRFKPTIYPDARGGFYESFNLRFFREYCDAHLNFMQDNQSYSHAGVLRGLHYQYHHPQGKWIRVTTGTIFDVAVDLRQSSPYFGQAIHAILSGDNQEILWIPPGFAHGFYVLEGPAHVHYKTTAPYRPEDAHTIHWKDKDLAIPWPIQTQESPLISENDARGLPFKSCPHFP